jgi:chitinase
MRTAFDAAGSADGKPYLITIAAGADAKFIEGDWLAELAKSLDWINLMTYDNHGSLEPRISGLNAPLRADPRDPSKASIEASVDRLIAAGIAPAKITLGLPFYGKSWEGCAPGPRGDGLYQPCERFGSELMLPAVREWVNRAGFERHWSESGRVPYVYNPASRVLVTYEDERSIRDKTWFARLRGLRGVMFWELGSDDNGVLRRVVATQVAH